jgi:hypothetical protein
MPDLSTLASWAVLVGTALALGLYIIVDGRKHGDWSKRDE